MDDTIQSNFSGESGPTWYSMRAGICVSVIVVIIFIAGLLFILNRNVAPTNVIISPASYPAGTQIETYKDLPSEFPADVVTVGSLLKHADIVRNTTDQNFMVTAIYSIAQPLPLAMSGELDTFKKAGWQVSDSKISANSGYISAVKDVNNSVVVTFTIDGAGSDASFQFSSKKS
jgi:hypothetical protein